MSVPGHLVQTGHRGADMAARCRDHGEHGAEAGHSTDLSPTRGVRGDVIGHMLIWGALRDRAEMPGSLTSRSSTKWASCLLALSIDCFVR